MGWIAFNWLSVSEGRPRASVLLLGGVGIWIIIFWLLLTGGSAQAQTLDVLVLEDDQGPLVVQVQNKADLYTLWEPTQMSDEVVLKQDSTFINPTYGISVTCQCDCADKTKQEEIEEEWREKWENRKAEMIRNQKLNNELLDHLPNCDKAWATFLFPNEVASYNRWKTESKDSIQVVYKSSLPENIVCIPMPYYDIEKMKAYYDTPR